MSQPLRFTARQTSQWSDQSRQDFLLKAVCEWQALHETCYGQPPRTGFDQAWQVADYLLAQTDALAQPPEPATVYSLVHAVLAAAERGARPEQLRAGVAAYCEALPADEAGLILLETICDRPSAPVRE